MKRRDQLINQEFGKSGMNRLVKSMNKKNYFEPLGCIVEKFTKIDNYFASLQYMSMLLHEMNIQ